MGFVSSIKDFIGKEPDDEFYDDYDGAEEYEDERDSVKRSSFSKFKRFDREREEEEEIPENDITIIKVRKLDDASSIASVLKDRRPVIFDVIEMDKTEDAEKVVDFMVGAVFALDGSVKRISGGIFIATPKNMKINTDVIGKKAASTVSFGLDL